MVLQEVAPQPPPVADVLQEYQCPICLDLLRSPVLLTCAHRYCWACLLAHSAASTRPSARPGSKLSGSGDSKQQQQAAAQTLLPGSSTSQQQQTEQQSADSQQQQQEPEQPDWQLAQGLDDQDEQADECATFDCAVCRKAQVLNLDRLQVDPHLDAFLQKLERQQRTGGVVSGSSSAAAATPMDIGRRSSSSMPIAIAHSAAQADNMLVDAKPSATTVSLAEASELAEAAAAAASSPSAAEVEDNQQQPKPALAQALPLSAAVAAPALARSPLPASPFVGGERPLLPPQLPQHSGRLVVCLDLDGTLVTTFTPKRAPMLPAGSGEARLLCALTAASCATCLFWINGLPAWLPYSHYRISTAPSPLFSLARSSSRKTAVSYVAGRGGKLNPNGVFVVERPGLGDFLHRIASFAEVRPAWSDGCAHRLHFFVPAKLAFSVCVPRPPVNSVPGG